MIGWTMCSGIGAPEVAAPWVDWRLAAEIENFPRAVLQQRFGYKLPEDQNQGDPLLWSDMTEVTPDLARSRGVPLPDVLVAGTPCQAFSVAGLRKGTEDVRGNLTLKFVETCHAIVSARPDGRLTVLWENVPGVLSDKGNAFGCFLAGLVGADDALSAPDGGSWPSVGMVSGPRSRVAWRVLDAQYFGVAQRRRRVFVVVDFGGAVDPAAVLFERQGLRGNTPPRRQAGESTAPSTAPCLRARSNASHRADTEAYVASTGDLFHCLNAGGMGRCDYETETMIAEPITFMSNASGANLSWNHDRSGTLRIGGDGGNAMAVSYPFDLNQITSKANRSQPDPQVCHTMPAASCAPHLAINYSDGGLAYGHAEEADSSSALSFLREAAGAEAYAEWGAAIIAALQSPEVLQSWLHGERIFGSGAFDTDNMDDIAQTFSKDMPAGIMRDLWIYGPNGRSPQGRGLVKQLAGKPTEALSVMSLVATFDESVMLNMREASKGAGVLLKALSTVQEMGRPYADEGEPEHPAWAVRRLTPVECARLQGFPDDHTAITYRGKPAADGPQYKALGNSMAVPVIAWLMDRIRASASQQRSAA
jgi:DNA (cytosine-5)-methyltransferase 1